MKQEDLLIFPVPREISLTGKKPDLSSCEWIILPEDASFRLKNRVLEMARFSLPSFVRPPRL